MPTTNPTIAARLARSGSAFHALDVAASSATHIVTACGLEVREGEWRISTDSRVGCGHCRRRAARRAS